MSALDQALAAADRPAAVALMHLLMEAPDEAAARAALARALAAADPPGLTRLRALEALWAAHPEAWATVRGTVAQIAHARDDATPAATLCYWAATFDRLVAAAPEASVALYSLGSPALLEAASREVVALMARWGLLAPGCDLLDLGCGIGRFAPLLAPHLGSYLGLDVSAGMIAEAVRRHGALPRTRFVQCGGTDLAAVPGQSLDLVLAADVFPYLVEAGGGLAAVQIAEIGRVLRPGGRALILNFSYRGDTGRDIAEVAEAAARARLAVERSGTRDLQSWDAVTFLLGKAEA